MNINKSEQREQKRFKNKHGMRVSGKSSMIDMQNAIVKRSDNGTMTKRSFNKIICSISTGMKLDVDKINSLDYNVRESLVRFIVRNRGPIVKELIPNGFDMNWLASCGYLYETTGREYTFVHTSEHHIK